MKEKNNEDSLKEENVLRTENEGGADCADALKKNSSALPPKFKDVSALAEAYNVLQAEFTRRCQRLKELEARAENRADRKEEEKKTIRPIGKEFGGKAEDDPVINAMKSDEKRGENLRTGSTEGELTSPEEKNAFLPTDDRRPAAASDKEKCEKKGDDATDPDAGARPATEEETERKRTAEKVAFLSGKEEARKESAGDESGRANACAESLRLDEGEESKKKEFSADELLSAVYANEKVRLKIVGDYLSSLKKGGAPMITGGAGAFALPPRKAVSIEEAGGLALRHFKK